MKTTNQILLGAALLTFSACSGAGEPTVTSASPAPVTASEVRAMTAPEPGASPAEYRERRVTLRLLGTQGEGELASATLTDTATWHARTYKLGETVGRSLKLAAITESAIELAGGPAGELTGDAPARKVRVGEEVQLRLVEHDFDTAAVDKGEHQWTVRAAAMARLLGRYGVGATAAPIEFAGLAGVKLGPVQPGSALARLGFQGGDLLFEVGGQPATPASLEALAAETTQSRSQVVTVKLGRGGALFERAYVVE